MLMADEIQERVVPTSHGAQFFFIDWHSQKHCNNQNANQNGKENDNFVNSTLARYPFDVCMHICMQQKEIELCTRKWKTSQVKPRQDKTRQMRNVRL